MKNYYFTFGQNHYTKDGTRMTNKWVRVSAANKEKAAEIFREKFSSKYMRNGPWEYSMCYSEPNFTECYFADGEFMFFEQFETEVSKELFPGPTLL